MNAPKLLDNSAPLFQIKTYLTDLLTSHKYSELSIATGYWDLPGMLEMLPSFEVFLDANKASEIRLLIGEEPKVRINQLDATRARELLMKMTTIGYLEKGGIKKGQIFRMSSKLYKHFGDSISYVREKGIDEVRYPELILEYVKKYGPISNRQVRELLGVDIYKACKLLNKLTKSGKLERIGTGDRNAKYNIHGKG